MGACQPDLSFHLFDKGGTLGLDQIRGRNLKAQPSTASVSSLIDHPGILCGRGETPVPSCSNIVEIRKGRSLLESVTSEELESACVISNLKVCCGSHLTAESLHLGNLLGIIVLSLFQRCAHTPVALSGGATARIGEPSGKSLEKPELDVETLERNILRVTETIGTVLGNNSGAEGGFVVLKNYDWWKDMRPLDFLKRGYDFVYLFDNEGVNVQIGRIDQWGNITAGTDLIRKISQAGGTYGLTFPLLLKSDGTKFVKSEDGAIWLSPSMLSSYKFYQYFFSALVADAVRFLKILTFLELEVVEEIGREMKSPGYVPNSAQRRLAEEVTRFVHGQEGLDEAIKATEALRPGAETALD
uniref:Tyrosine--tRNA ligase n=1 Tax=Kalanchoe fedtschenkoi TaxID=63787 RepID=A0A7N0TFC7_KALFE